MAHTKVNYNLCKSMIACDGTDLPTGRDICCVCREKQDQREVREARADKLNKRKPVGPPDR